MRSSAPRKQLGEGRFGDASKKRDARNAPMHATLGGRAPSSCRARPKSRKDWFTGQRGLAKEPGFRPGSKGFGQIWASSDNIWAGFDQSRGAFDQIWDGVDFKSGLISVAMVQGSTKCRLDNSRLCGTGSTRFVLPQTHGTTAPMAHPTRSLSWRTRSIQLSCRCTTHPTTLCLGVRSSAM